MTTNHAWQMLAKNLPGSAAVYALVDCAVTSGFLDDQEIYTRLNKPDIQKHSLFSGHNAWAIDQVAPVLVRLDNQPDLRRWIFENGWGRGWAIFLAGDAEIKTILTHFRAFLAVQAENGRKVFFRFYDPVILGDFLPLLDQQEAITFFGPVIHFVIEDAQGQPLFFAKPKGRLTENLDPSQVVTAKRDQFSALWNQRLLKQHVQTYQELGFAAAAEPAADAVTLTDKAGTRVRLQKTANGAAVTTGQDRIFKYTLTTCKQPARVVDPAGHKIDFDIQERQNRPDPQPGENLLHAIRMDQGRKTWVFEYDDMDHLQRIDYPDGTRAEIAHESRGHLTGFIGRNGHGTFWERDFQERLTRLTDANGHQTLFDYDGLSSPAAIAFADGSIFNFAYTEAHILEKFLAGNQLVAEYRVDKQTGSWKVDYIDGTSAEFIVRNEQIIRAANAAGSVDLAYDESGHLASETFAGRTVTYHRDGTGQLNGLTTPFGHTIQYLRDKENRVAAIGDWDGQTIEIRYAPSGALLSIVYPNGTCLEQGSTIGGLPVELRLTAPGRTGPIFHKKYRRDLLDRVTRISDGEKEIAYTYDPQGRVLGVKSTIPGLDESFRIDAKANRLADKRTAYSLNAADKIVQAGQNTFEYDPVGNLTAGTCPQGGASYAYTALNRLDTVEQASGRAQYVYDAFGRRVAKQVGRSRTRFIWAGSQLLHEIQCQPDEPDAASQTDYLFFPQTPVLLAMRRDRQTCWAAFGHRYEVLCLTDRHAKPVWQAEYDAFGNARIETGSDIFQPFRLAGQYCDTETGLHYNQARYYHPGLGRYLSLDPLFLQGGDDNFYAYCRGDPINHIDPNGEFIFIPILIGAALGAAIAGGIEGWRQHQAGQGMDGFAIAKAALLGGAIGAVGGGMGAAVEAALAAGSAGTALASGTLAGMGAAGFLSGTAGSAAEQCAERQISGQGIDPRAIAQQALADGVVGAGIGPVTFGAGGFRAKRLRRAAGTFRPQLPAQRPVSLLTKAKAKSRNLTSRLKSAATRKNGRSNAFCVSDPVNPITGEVVLEQTDFTLSGRISLTWTRHYGSQSDYDGLLGPGWQSPADARLAIDADSLVTFYDGTPKAAVFEALPDQTPVMEASDGALLEAVEENYQVRLKSGLTYHFARRFTANHSPVLQISDPHGHYLRFDRQEGKLVQILDDNGQSMQIDCHQGRITQIRRNDKSLVRYLYQDDLLTAAIDVLGHARRFAYRQGRMVRHTDKNKLSFHYAYDDTGKCTHVWGDNGLYDYHIEYLAYQRSARVTDSRGRMQTLAYDKDNLPVQVIDQDGGATGYAYDDLGRMIKVTDPLGRSTQYDYDNAGNVTDIIRPDNNLISFFYDANHRPIQILDPNGKIWEQRFDDQGRLIEKIDPLGGRTWYKYNRGGDLTAVCDRQGHVTRFEWDRRGLLSTLTDPAGHSTHYQRSLAGDVSAVIDPSGGSRRYLYDGKSRLCKVVHPAGQVQGFDWDPEDNLVLHTDENGHQTRFEYGGVNKIVRRINADGTRVTYQYDSEENLIGVTNEKGQTHRFEYDLSGRLSAQTDYYGHSSGYTYDPAGQLIQSMDPLERIITYGYDPAGRLQTKTFESDECESFDWDANGNLIGFQSPGAAVQRFFDAANNLIAEKSGEFSVEYRYDKNGRRTQRTTSHGNRVQYAYDFLGAVRSIRINDREPVSIKRNNLGQIVQEHFSAYLQRTFGYSEQGLLTHQSINSVRGQIQRRYEYDPTGRLIAKHDSHKGPWQFSYDPMDRIRQATDPERQVHRFAFDPAGDLLEHMPDIGYGPRCAKHNGTVYQYDAAGNLAERQNHDDHIRFTWDEHNRLTTARKADDTRIHMVYDALGRRRRKAVNGQRTVFAWDGDALLSEQSEDQAPREYVHYPGTFEPLAVIDGDGKVYYYHNDLNGLPQELTTPSGDIVWSATYDALGRVRQILVDEVAQPLRFQGQYDDQELALCYNRYRYFDPQICSFISQDPLGFAAGENVYAYAPNVWGWVDPLGLACSQKPRKVYRGGSATKNNLTPRPQDIDGLSTFDNLSDATPPGSKAQVIDTAKLKELEAVPDAPPKGHVSIKPIDSTKMQEWISSRGSEETHPFTGELMKAIIETIKRPKG